MNIVNSVDDLEHRESGLDFYKKRSAACKSIYKWNYNKNIGEYGWLVQERVATDKWVYFWPFDIAIDGLSYQGMNFELHFRAKEVVKHLKTNNFYASKWVVRNIIRFSRKVKVEGGGREAYCFDVCLSTGSVRIVYDSQEATTLDEITKLINYLDITT